HQHDRLPSRSGPDPRHDRTTYQGHRTTSRARAGNRAIFELHSVPSRNAQGSHSCRLWRRPEITKIGGTGYQLVPPIFGGDQPMKKSEKKTDETLLREHAEQQFADELSELTKADERRRPPNWRLSPWAIAIYILGGKLDNGFEVSPKYIGQR